MIIIPILNYKYYIQTFKNISFQCTYQCETPNIPIESINYHLSKTKSRIYAQSTGYMHLDIDVLC